MTKQLPILPRHLSGAIELPASKSISNRLLLMNAIADGNWQLDNLSSADDTVLMKSLLETIRVADKQKPTELYCKNAGTVFRFLTAFLAVYPGEWILKGDERLMQRPIKDLTDALTDLGADIQFSGPNETAPLLIKGKRINADSVNVKSNKSSQFISALMMIGASFSNGLTINLQEDPISKPYIQMTAKLLQNFGCSIAVNNSSIEVRGPLAKHMAFFIESDWTAASYFYALMALSEGGELTLDHLYKDSIQGDSILQEVFSKSFGVETHFENEKAIIKKTGELTSFFEMDFTDNPDLAQTICVLCVALNIEAKLNGLKSLRYKETDRFLALETELKKIGANIQSQGDSLLIKKSRSLNFDAPIQTYDDHRMAMAFSIFSMITYQVKIENPSVIEKSFPKYFLILSELSTKKTSYEAQNTDRR